MVRVLVAEGNSNDGRRQIVESAGRSMAEGYAETLRAIDPTLAIDLFSPADEADRLPAPLNSYDGVVITGSSLHIYRAEPSVTRQIDFLREVFDVGVPVFGSCWGLQLGVVAAGGTVIPNPKRREVPFARSVTLTAAGKMHQMHQSRPGAFDALAIHLDVVSVLPPESVITAFNDMAAVQAVEFRSGRSLFWGVQYHPEFELPYMASILRRNASSLVAEAAFSSEGELAELVNAMDSCDSDGGRAQHPPLLSVDVVDRRRRTIEIANWLKLLAPKMI
ncbi:type 1 glutamine amidotransferase [Rhodopseudomonas palustris]|uniref:type 1 glutamine amidotransferase n=1 Tax=Rhodopseudomonas palustris TaxID=1076 RepID=UPI0021F39CBB|nr:type 1 glutamine amidotransferase [Rhodopseudomonas palustris]UYO51496.1 type 1 glutamine amidotransferase [Rhodopseudomonas palustris]